MLTNEAKAILKLLSESARKWFVATVARFINEEYNGMSTRQDAADYFEDSEIAKSQLDDKYADEFGVEIDSISDQLDAEFGVEIPPLLKQLSADEKLRFVGILRYLQEDPERVQYINQVTGIEGVASRSLTAEQIALNYSLSRERLMELAEADDPELCLFLDSGTVKKAPL